MTSSLSTADVVDRLAGRLEPVPRSPFWFPPSGMAFIGAVTGNSFRIYSRGRGRNSWRWVFTGDVRSTGEGSELAGTIGPPQRVAILSLVWIAIVALFFVLGLVAVINRATAANLLLTIGGPVAMLTFFGYITNVGWVSAGREWAEMEKWLKATVRATPEPTVTP